MAVTDVLVVGAGPAGSTAAALLARRGLDVTLVDRAVFPRDKPCAEFLSPGAVAALAEAGLGHVVRSEERLALRGFAVYPWEGEPFRAEYGGRAGVAVRRTELDHALLQEAARAGARVRQGVRAVAIRGTPDGPAVAVQARDGGDGEIAARLVIAADGVRSVLARRLGLLRPAGPRRVALVTHLAGVAGLGSYGEMHVMPGAYCGVAPLSAGLANVALVVDVAEAAALRGRPEAYLRERLHGLPHLAARLAGARQATPVLTVGPMAFRARRASADGVLLAGDAAGFLDPFTGQGVYRAVRGALLAARVAEAALREGDTSARRLREYDRLRREFRGQHAVERLVQAFLARPALFRRAAARLARRPALAERLLGVTGDVLPARAVLSPAYLARLVV
ncbi:MAG TPA: NAD(P)/FAD-dependent oxidoreductase [Dehalococcoidia bacterium]